MVQVHPATMNATCTDVLMSLVLNNLLLEDVSKHASRLPQPLQLYFMETAPKPKVLILMGINYELFQLDEVHKQTFCGTACMV